mgnify:CR=1 FL=1
MRLPLSLLLPVLVLELLLDWYIWRAFKLRCRRNPKFWCRLTIVQAVVFAIFPLWMAFVGTGTDDSAFKVAMWMLYGWISVYAAKLVWVFFDLVAKLPRLWHGRRWKWLAACGWLAVPVFIFMWWGALVERFRIDVERVDIVRPDLPEAFDGFTIAQFSDIHLGTYGSDTTFVKKVVDRINDLRPDMIVFTGDIVNRHTSEMEPFVATLAGLEAPYGVFSILGNHDYGDYYQWDSPSDKVENMALLYHLEQLAGLRMLNNNTDFIYSGGDSIALVGVENIGDPPFPVYGDLDAAYPGDLNDPVFKILLSHNPAHWADDISEAPDKNIALTLSGHTHAMQMRLLGWSPAKFRYRNWGGLYADTDSAHLLYVNIGIGEVGMPARLGDATPEITLFTLKRGR